MLKRTIQALLLIALVLAALALVVSILHGQEGIVKMMSAIVRGRHASEKIQEALTPGRLNILRAALGIAILTILFLLRVSEGLSVWIGRTAKDLSELLSATWSTVRRGEGKWILLLPFGVTVYGLLRIPVNFDEALTYFEFTTRGPVASIAYYPFPNNHVLHSLLTNLTRHLPIPALAALRIMPVTLTLVSNAICLHLMTKLHGPKMAMVITAICSVLFFSLYYGYMSRGYYLVSLFFLVCYYCAARIARGDDEGKHRNAFVLASIAGFYTMPSFLYPFVTLGMYMFQRRPATIGRLFIMGITIPAVAALLYLPIILVNGLSALIGNPYVKPISRPEVLRELPQFFGATLTEITGFHWIWTIAILAISLAHVLIHRQKEHLRDMAFFLIMPVVILILHSVIPFPRTFCYYAFLLGMLALLPYAPYLMSITPRKLLSILLVLQVLFCWRFFQIIRPYEERDPQVNMTAWDINQKIAGNKRYFSAGALMGTNLRFELETRLGYMDRVTFRDAPVNADTLVGYDHIIIGRLLDSTQRRRPTYTGPYFTVYDGAPLPAPLKVNPGNPSEP